MAGDGLLRVHLRRRAQDDRVHVRARQRLVEVVRDMLRAVLLRDFLRLGQLAADDGRDLHAVDVLQPVEVLDAEGAGAGECDADGLAHCLFSRTRWPTAVFDAGT
jgi:hypothetical protein